jgi:hypothetical protein
MEETPATWSRVRTPDRMRGATAHGITVCLRIAEQKHDGERGVLALLVLLDHVRVVDGGDCIRKGRDLK